MIFNTTDRDNFVLSMKSIGEGVVVIKPQLEGEWCGITILWTPEPLLSAETNWNAFMPVPFSDSVSL